MIQSRDGIFVGEDADHISAPFDLAIETFERIDGVDFRPVILREGHEGGVRPWSTLAMAALMPS